MTTHNGFCYGSSAYSVLSTRWCIHSGSRDNARRPMTSTSSFKENPRLKGGKEARVINLFLVLSFTSYLSFYVSIFQSRMVFRSVVGRLQTANDFFSARSDFGTAALSILACSECDESIYRRYFGVHSDILVGEA